MGVSCTVNATREQMCCSSTLMKFVLTEFVLRLLFSIFNSNQQTKQNKQKPVFDIWRTKRCTIQPTFKTYGHLEFPVHSVLSLAVANLGFAPVLHMTTALVILPNFVRFVLPWFPCASFASLAVTCDYCFGYDFVTSTRVQQ